MPKILFEKLPVPADARGKLIMVTAMTPTTAGEGKTTTAIGLVSPCVRKASSAPKA